MNAILATGVLALAASVSAGQIVAIEGLVGTGSNGAGGVLAIGQAERHYSGDLIVVEEFGSYADSLADATWIGQTPSNVSDPAGSIFSASLTFDLAGLDPSTAVIMGSVAGDDVVTVSLNGEQLPFFALAQTLEAFEFTDGFLPGLNTITFAVENSTFPGSNPSALFVGSLSGTAAVLVVPAPASAAVLLGGAFVLGRRRH